MTMEAMWPPDMHWPLAACEADAAEAMAASKPAGVVFYVAPNGRDTWSGTLAEPNSAATDGPLATLAKARDAMRKLKAKQKGPPDRDGPRGNVFSP